MKASLIKVASLTTYEDCEKAIESIQADWDNVVGGSKAFFSGYNTTFTTSAANKIKAIEKKMDGMVGDCDNE